ncbi:unnamed protein product [Rotaria magnacalcarata]|uniref:Uncharacterized protein n=1 Tax=Rotaria magnacalcarata TaxID=392030 RepID=A0A816GTG9_9BILA|nr:unnamed protein product [Rotaria magnacalcarata]CAF1678016.1 unnamed protein product [Rotaria magnacalcarata]CAF2099474.1 unnamed protein product [Rotaria magnacalcarata]CAF4105742.1 unnamed protein product [Rotaria magnacalcarata]CAF4129625.1 unnamed protein product [Rotaria magnacalcarata]
MTVILVTAATIVATGGAAAPAAVAAAEAAAGVGTAAAGVGTAAAGAGAAAAEVGVILTGATATAAGAGAGAAEVGAVLTGATATAAGTAGTTGAVASILTGPVGWFILGTSEIQSSAVYTFDCWKPVLHDESQDPSNGRTLREVAMDSRIKSIIRIDNNTDLPHFILQNVWDEKFFIEYITLPSYELAAHAIKI